MSNYLENLMTVQMAYVEKYSSENAEELLLEELRKNRLMVFRGVNVSVCDEITYATQGISPDYACVAGWMPELGYIVLNTATSNLPVTQLHALLAHEVGHSVLGHDTIEQHQELQADAYSVSLGYDMLSCLTAVRNELSRFANTTEIPVDFKGIDERIQTLTTN